MIYIKYDALVLSNSDNKQQVSNHMNSHHFTTMIVSAPHVNVRFVWNLIRNATWNNVLPGC